MARRARFNYRTNKKSHFNIWRFFSVLLIVAGVVCILFFTKTIKLSGQKNTNSTQSITQEGQKSPSPSNNSSSGSTPKKSSTSNNITNSGGATNTNGSASVTTTPSQWATSQSGEITVEQPYANATINSGSMLSGTASVSQVNFTLIDNEVGVIAQGTLNVVNGKFSGDLSFTPHSSSGRLDVYSTNTPGGPEMNLIEISVNF